MSSPGKRLRQVYRWFDHFFSSFQKTHSVMKNRWWSKFTCLSLVSGHQDVPRL